MKDSYQAEGGREGDKETRRQGDEDRLNNEHNNELCRQNKSQTHTNTLTAVIDSKSAMAELRSPRRLSKSSKSTVPVEAVVVLALLRIA